MTRGSTAIAVALEPLASGIGEPTLGWVYNGLDSSSATPHPRPNADTTYTVNVNGVRIGGSARNFSYNVTVFDPDTTGSDSVTTTVNGSSAPPAGTASTYTVVTPAFADSFQYRTEILSGYSKTYGAELGLEGLIATTGAGYSPVQTVSRSSGTAAYYLAHPSPRSDQILLLPETFYATGSANLTFFSRLGVATSGQVARIQVSTDEGGTWTDVFSQAGAGGSTSETSFVSRGVSLAAYAGRTLRVRFNYTVSPSGLAFQQTDPTSGVGWFIDNISVSGVLTVAPDAPVTVSSGSTFSISPAAPGTFSLQARGLLFGTYPLEWGPVTTVVAAASNTPAVPSRLSNLSVRSTAGVDAQILIVGLTIGGAGTSGPKPILVRAAGPALSAFGLYDLLADPKLDVLNSGGAVVASNDNWNSDPNANTAGRQLGGFPFADNSKDAALYRADSTFVTGGYSVKISGVGGTTGLALAEIYDGTAAASFTAATPRLINLSARTTVGTGGDILIVGLTVTGSAPVKVLIRAVGPGLTQFGLTGVLADPQLEVFNTFQASIARNDNWDSATTLAQSTSVGAFPLTPGSKDAVLVTTLQPGGYTVQITGVNNTTGIALVEVYELP